MTKIFFVLCLAAQAVPAFSQGAVQPAVAAPAGVPDASSAPAAGVAVGVSTAPAKPVLTGTRQKGLEYKAKVQLGLKEYKEAAALWSELLGLRPDYYPAYAERAYALRMAGQKKKAAADFETAFAADPEQPRAYLLRGAAACASGDYEQASADLGKALELDPAIKRSILYGKTRDSVRAKKKCK